MRTVTEKQESGVHISTVKTYLNSQHPNMKFTRKVEQNNKLPFLVTTITFHSMRLAYHWANHPSHNHPFNATDFKVLTSHPNKIDPIKTESLHMINVKPELNDTAMQPP